MSMDPPQSNESNEKPTDTASAPIFESDETTPAVSDELFDVLFAGEVDAWPQRTRHGIRVAWPVMVMVGLLLVLGGMGLGSYLQRTRPTSASSLFSQLNKGASRTGSGTGTFAGAGGFANATTGTVTDVKGNDLYLTTSSGSLVKVLVSSNTTVERNATTPLKGLQVGDTVVVLGSTKKGVVSATSVIASAKGVTTNRFVP